MSKEDLKICYGLIDSTGDILHEGMRKLVTDLNFAFDSIMMPLVDTDHIAMLNYVADETDYTHLVMFDSGTVLVNSDKFRKAMYHLCEEEWLVAGHIMFREEDHYPYLHHQACAINIGIWKELRRPGFGLKIAENMTLPAVMRSPENVHDDYTPLWLKPQLGATVNVTRVKFGWQMIAMSLKNNLTVRNIPMDARSSKIYMYPDDGPDAMVDAVSRIRRGEQVDTSSFSNDSQRRFLHNQKWAMSDSSQSIVFVFNTGDATVNILKPSQATAFWTTASGFKSFHEWVYRGSLDKVQVNTFDYNPRALDLWRTIYSDWDGRDLYSFIKSRHDDCDNEDLYCWGNKFDYETPREASDRQEAMLHDFCGGRDAFISAWDSYRKLDHRYHNINLIEQPTEMASRMDDDRDHYVWINNIFYFNRTIRRHGIEHIQSRFVDFVSAIRDRDVANQICGQSASMHFFDPADRLYDLIMDNPEPRYQCQLDFRNHGVRRWAGHPLPY
jgi:hypothetical protein